LEKIIRKLNTSFIPKGYWNPEKIEKTIIVSRL
jgi:hypothetical protein